MNQHLSTVINNKLLITQQKVIYDKLKKITIICLNDNNQHTELQSTNFDVQNTCLVHKV